MNNGNKIVESLSKHLFWDIDISNIDEKKHQRFIIKKVLQFGTYNDWKVILNFYGKETIINNSKTIKDLDKKTLSFLSVVSGIPKTEFLCYTTEQSMPKHWNF